MKTLNDIWKSDATILALGNHHAIVQSILDFDYACGKKRPSVRGIITAGRKMQKFFFGKREVRIPCYPSVATAKEHIPSILWMLNMFSGRRAYQGTVEFFTEYTESIGGHIFAEHVPEKDAISLIHQFGSRYRIFGPSGVGFLIPGSLKLGAIGGIDVEQIEKGVLWSPGNIAVISTSGGMTNELIRAIVTAERRVSFAAAVGGDRFPICSLTDAFLLAEGDEQTDACVYFGELGGVDEYEIISLIKARKLTKPVVAYIAGSIDEVFEEHVQFGHAKALVKHKDESAKAKREALRRAGVQTPDTFGEFLEALRSLPHKEYASAMLPNELTMDREHSLFSTRKLIDVEAIPAAVKRGKLVSKEHGAFVAGTAEVLLGRAARSPITLALIDELFALSIDHGGAVSGAVNTMIAARAGKDLISSLAAGLLTIGPRFGGAVNDAAASWLDAVSKKQTPLQFVQTKKVISGIGHKKYRVGLPDPRVEALAQFATLLKKHPHYDFARAVEQITTAKNGSLILNIDGVIAALLLDILKECEHMSHDTLQARIDAEVFNAFFIIPRIVGFTGHYLEQKLHDEGLFRLPEELLFTEDTKKHTRRKSGPRH